MATNGLPPRKRFQMTGKGFYLTFPQCGVPPTMVLDLLKAHLGSSLLWAIVAQEKHQDGNLHLHMGFQLEKPKNVKDPNYWDFLTGKHGNYQTMRNPQKVIRYCQKEDPHPAVYGNLPETSSKVKTADVIAQQIMQGTPLQSLVQEYPGYVLQHKRKIDEFYHYAKEQETIMQKKAWPGGVRFRQLSKSPTTNHVNMTVCGWLENNIRKPRAFKSPQLCVSAPPNHNKTSLVNILEEMLTIYHVPQTENFYDFYDDDTCDLVVFDEFRGAQHNVQWLNSFLQGSTMNIRKKGTQYLKRKNPPCLILTNYSLTELFPDTAERSMFLARVTFVELHGPFPIQHLDFYTPGSTPILISDDEDEQQDVPSDYEWTNPPHSHQPSVWNITNDTELNNKFPKF